MLNKATFDIYYDMRIYKTNLFQMFKGFVYFY